MNAIIITIGDEILSGNTIDTNSNFIASELLKIGINTKKIYTISDDVSEIEKTLNLALKVSI